MTSGDSPSAAATVEPVTPAGPASAARQQAIWYHSMPDRGRDGGPGLKGGDALPLIDQRVLQGEQAEKAQLSATASIHSSFPIACDATARQGALLASQPSERNGTSDRS